HFQLPHPVSRRFRLAAGRGDAKRLGEWGGAAARFVYCGRVMQVDQGVGVHGRTQSACAALYEDTRYDSENRSSPSTTPIRSSAPQCEGLAAVGRPSGCGARLDFSGLTGCEFQVPQNLRKLINVYANNFMP